MKREIIILIVAVMVLSFVTFSIAQQKGTAPTLPQKPGTAKDATAPTSKNLIRIDPSSLKRLQAPTNRSTVINSLMINPASKGTIESASKKGGVAVSQLAAKSLDGKPVSGNPVSVNPSQKCQDINYNVGIKFAPFTNAPMCWNPNANKNIPLGVFSEVGSIGIARGMTPLLELIQKNTLPMVTYRTDEWSFVIFDVLLPPEVGTYLVTVHIVPMENTPIIDLKTKGALSLAQTAGGLFSMRLANLPSIGGASFNIPSAEIQLTPLSNGSGFAGIFVPQFSNYISLCLSAKAYRGILFGGFTIMRL